MDILCDWFKKRIWLSLVGPELEGECRCGEEKKKKEAGNH